MSGNTPNFNTHIPEKIMTPDRVSLGSASWNSSTACQLMSPHPPFWTT